MLKNINIPVGTCEADVLSICKQYIIRESYEKEIFLFYFLEDRQLYMITLQIRDDGIAYVTSLKKLNYKN